MPWALRTTTIGQNPDRPQFLTVTFRMTHTDGRAIDYTEPYVSDQGIIPRLAADWLRQFNKIEEQAGAPLSSDDVAAQVAALLTPPAAAEPTEAQRADVALSEARQKLETLKALQDAGAAVSEKALGDAVAAVKIAAETVLTFAVDAGAVATVKR